MDILDTVREMKPTYPASGQAPRRALHQEIARSQRRRPLGRVAVASVAGAAVAAVAITGSLLLPPEIAGQPQAASASAYLNETAASIRAAAVAPMKVSITTQHLGMIGGPNEKFQPFGNLRTGATAAVITESSSTYISDPDRTYSETSRTDLHAVEVYGDEAAVDDAWTSYYGASYPIGAKPATSHEVQKYDAYVEGLSVPTSDFPSDAAAFLAAWETGMEEKMAAEKAEAAEMPQEGEPDTNGLYESIEAELDIPAAEHMLNELGHSVSLLTAPAEYRAIFLEALALADGITVEQGATAIKVLVYETDDARYRLTVNPEAGAIVKIEKFLLRVLPELWNRHTKDDPLVEVGSAPFLPQTVPDFAVSFSSEPVD